MSLTLIGGHEVRNNDDLQLIVYLCLTPLIRLLVEDKWDELLRQLALYTGSALSRALKKLISV